MTKYAIAIIGEYGIEVCWTTEACSKRDRKELVNFVKSGIEAYEDWKVEGD